MPATTPTTTPVTTDKLKTLQAVLDGLMNRYQARVPDVEKIIQTMTQEEVIRQPSDIQNDHIAFRTLGVPHLGIGSLETIFLHYGFERRDPYDFPAKKLNAYWYSPPEPRFPRIFISELRTDELSKEAQRLIRSYTDEVKRDPVDDLDLDNAEEVDAFLHSPLWQLPSLEDYERLAQESEYAAWVIYNRYYLNHFTISVHTLPEGYDTVADFNTFLKKHGFKLNDSGGEVKTSPDGKLLQSSTVAKMIEAEFAKGEKKEISGSYVEFAERRVLDEYQNLPKEEVRREHRREGFEAGNADKIFESTYSSQTQRG